MTIVTMTKVIMMTIMTNHKNDMNDHGNGNHDTGSHDTDNDIGGNHDNHAMMTMTMKNNNNDYDKSL